MDNYTWEYIQKHPQETKRLLGINYNMQYRRAKTPGATYFFTLVTHHRRPILGESENSVNT